MYKIDIRITETDNDAFYYNDGREEFERIIRQATNRVINMVHNSKDGINDNNLADTIPLYDINGNKIGFMVIE